MAKGRINLCGVLVGVVMALRSSGVALAGPESEDLARRAKVSVSEHLDEGKYPARSLRGIASSAPLLGLEGRRIEKVRYRRRTRARLGGSRDVRLRGVLVNGRLGVIFSREDLTAGLVGYPASTVDGYAPESAYQLIRNVVLSAGRRPTGRP